MAPPPAVIGRALLDPDRIELDLGIDSDALHSGPVLAVPALLDAALVLLVLDAAPDGGRVRWRGVRELPGAGSEHG